MSACSSSSSPMKRGAMSSRARHPSTSAADTGDRVRKYLAIFLRLKCFFMSKDGNPLKTGAGAVS